MGEVRKTGASSSRSRPHNNTYGNFFTASWNLPTAVSSTDKKRKVEFVCKGLPLCGIVDIKLNVAHPELNPRHTNGTGIKM